MKPFLVLAVAPLFLAAPACAQSSHGSIIVNRDNEPVVQGSGRYVREARAAGSFSAIESVGSERLEIAVGAAPSVEIEIDDNLLGNLTTRIENGVLKIGSKGSFSTTRAPVVRVTLPSLEAVRLSGSGDAEIRGLQGGTLSLDSRGSGGFHAPSGRADRVTLRLAGSGESDLTRLQVAHFAVDLSGSGEARIRADDSIDATVNGSGAVLYGGAAADVEVQVNGTGSARRID